MEFNQRVTNTHKMSGNSPHPNNDISQLLSKRLNSGGGSMRPKVFLAVILLVGIVILMTTYSGVSFASRIDEEKSSLMPASFPEAQNRSHLPGAAYVFLAMGAQANQMNCPAAIESLVRYAGWDGDIYLITDQPNCFDAHTIISNANMKKEKFHYMTMADSSFSKGGVDWQHPEIGFRQSRVRSFEMKTRLFDIIQDPAIQTIAYADCDIIFAQPNCATKFLTSGPTWEEADIRFSHVSYDEHKELKDIHAGTFIVHREHSQIALKLWRDAISLGLDEGDNNAYMRLYHLFETYNATQRDAYIHQFLSKVNGNPALRGSSDLHFTTPLDTHKDTHKDTLLTSNPSQDNLPLLAFPTQGLSHNPLKPGVALVHPNQPGEDSNNWFEKFFEPSLGTKYCMNHISKARCGKYGRDVVQDFVKRFHLKTYEDNRYAYCTSTLLQPLLYGWFPFGYLPFCPKMETIL